MTRAVAKKDQTALAARPDYMNQDAGRGQENVGVDDITIPRIDVVQSLSPQRKKTSPEYIEGAEEGILFNSLTKQLYGTELQFVPVYFRKEWVIWKDRDSGGGFRGAYASEAEANRAKAQLEDGSMCEVVDTGQHFGLIVGGEKVEEVVISMSKSKMKASRQLNSMVKMTGGDRFSKVYTIKSALTEGPKGEYYNLAVNPGPWVDEDIYNAGAAMYDSIVAGERTIAHDDTVVEAEEF